MISQEAAHAVSSAITWLISHSPARPWRAGNRDTNLVVRLDPTPIALIPLRFSDPGAPAADFGPLADTKLVARTPAHRYDRHQSSRFELSAILAPSDTDRRPETGQTALDLPGLQHADVAPRPQP